MTTAPLRDSYGSAPTRKGRETGREVLSISRTSDAGIYFDIVATSAMRVLGERVNDSFLDRYWAKVVEGPGCWGWTASPDGCGYGRIRSRPGGRFLTAHRVAYELAKGPIPEGMEIDHLCRVRYCVNPVHLEAVTRVENNRRMWAARRAA